MARLLVLVEGETEETFVKEVLRPHLGAFGFHDISPRILGNARLRDRRGGIRGWPECRKDVLRYLKEDKGRFVTTFVDYYALPQTAPRAWPGRAVAGMSPFPQKAQAVEKALLADIQIEDPACALRFVPFVVMHEFEGLLFSDTTRFAVGVGHPGLAPALAEIRGQFKTPEEINDSPITAPSKRIIALIPGYQKPLFGNLAALEVGLATIRRECPHFNDWLTRLESITPNV